MSDKMDSDGKMSQSDQSKLTNVLNSNEQDQPLPSIGNGKIPPRPGSKSSFRVEFEGPKDKSIPYNWPHWKKLIHSAVLVFSTLVVNWGSAIYGCGLVAIESQFKLGVTPANLGTTLYVLGFGFGPVLWGPLSERYGRKRPLVVGMLLFVCFTFATSTGKDVQTIMICRFWSGFSGSATISVIPAWLGDMFLPSDRTAIALYSLAVLGGPMVAPVAGEYMLQGGLGWRWLLYTTGMGGALALLGISLLPEPFQPIILAQRAAVLRRKTGNWALHAQHDAVEAEFQEIVYNTVLRPIQMTMTEPILFLMSLYQGVVYAILYMSLQVEAIPLIFEGYGWTGAKVYLPFTAVFVGALLYVLFSTYIMDVRYNRKVEHSRFKVIPEARLPLLLVGGILGTISLFWLFWTGAYPKTEATPNGCHWTVPVIGLGVFGFAFGASFIPVTNYLLDSYLLLAASAMAGNELVRDLLASSFPLFTTQMFSNLGIQWAGTLLACLMLVLTPVPFMLRAFGKKLRSKSKYAYVEDSDPQFAQKDSEEH